ncbi:ATP-binding protein [Cellulosimicrobium cellulans]|uniref:ATP-binding protein n=1 Tax=Cellulosimicrobium cellulans TaxID=1710 RepID=UPI0035D60795
MAGFVGRATELRELAQQLDVVRTGGRADAGVAVLLRGRRRVGKSRLVTELIEREAVPSVYFQAARHAPPGDELAAFAEAVAQSDLPGAVVAEGNKPDSLSAALRLLAAALPAESPAIVVVDELPWLLEGIQGGAGELQRVWDRELSRRPVLLLLLGSDLAMMEALGRPDQPFHGRATEMLLRALSPRDVARMTGLTGSDAFDAFLVTGGQPLVAQEWQPEEPPVTFVRRAYERATSALVVSGTRVLDGELPSTSHARLVLTAIGGKGERTHSRILQALDGSISPTTLDRSLGLLTEKRVIAADEPLSTRSATKDRRWRVSDPALRFWLAMVEPALPDIDRGRPDLAAARFETTFSSWRGRAIEPVVREALARLLPDETWPGARDVGGWWPRNNTPEIDLVAADVRPARTIAFVGSIKWHARTPFTSRDVDALAADAVHVPGVGAATPLVAVCPAGADDDPRLSRVWTADDLLAAWP